MYLLACRKSVFEYANHTTRSADFQEKHELFIRSCMRGALRSEGMHHGRNSMEDMIILSWN